MNYQRIYHDLVQRGKRRVSDRAVYTESHHIVPRCMGGDDTNVNLVELTAREHFLAHWLLHKIHPKNFKVLAAWNAFSQAGRNNSRVTSHLYSICREKWINELRSRKHSHPEWWDLWTKNASNTVWMNDGKKNFRIKAEDQESAIKSGKIAGRLYFSRTSHRQEHRDKIAARYAERKEQGWQNPNKGKPQLKFTCVHCGKQCGAGLINRWHNDNCKVKRNDQF